MKVKKMLKIFLLKTDTYLWIYFLISVSNFVIYCIIVISNQAPILLRELHNEIEYTIDKLVMATGKRKEMNSVVYKELRWNRSL